MKDLTTDSHYIQCQFIAFTAIVEASVTETFASSLPDLPYYTETSGCSGLPDPQ
jgi:hypothetical protein